MHVETLNIFCDVVRHQSFSRGAAEEMVERYHELEDARDQSSSRTRPHPTAHAASGANL